MSEVRLSIVIPVLNSHEVVRRQLLHFRKMALPDDVELIIVDDGSDPPLELDDEEAELIRTNDKRPWTQPKARNIGAAKAKGTVLLFTDIDHIVTREAVEFGRTFAYDYGKFKRSLGILDESGNFSQEPEALMEFGLPETKARGRLRISCHTLSMFIRAELFAMVGGFREKLGSHPTHDDGNMKRRLKRMDGIRKCPDDERPYIYMIPNGRYCGDKDANPQGLFHNLKRA
ncbi:MAG: glycosyltransferase [Planctomycetota bacterium]|jgi:glycosyltransferase involved in cell wall biosynthesis